MAKKRVLGRDLADLLGHLKTNEIHETHLEGELKYLRLEQIVAGKYQPRQNFSEVELQELAESIRAQGVLQPIIVRSIEMDRYEIIAGERRFRAAKMAGLTTIPALVRELPDEAAIAIALIENIQRENLNPLETAQGIQRLADEFKMSHEQVANIIGKSRSQVSNLIRLLKLPEQIKNLLSLQKIEMGHARALLALTAEQQIIVANIIVSKGLSVRQTESYIQLLLAEKTPKMNIPLSADLMGKQQQLQKKLGMKIRFKMRDQQRGRVIISFKDQQQLEKLIEELLAYSK